MQPESQKTTPASSSDGDDDKGPFSVRIQWGPAISAIKTAVAEAFPASPSFDASSPAPFRSYWYDVFTRLAETMASDDSVPERITSPAVTRFNIILYGEGGAGSCPCCLNERDPEILLENESGVGKVDMVIGLRDALYDERAEESEGADRLVFDSDWMCSPVEGPGEEKYTYDECYGEDAVVAKIWVFWCTWKRFGERLKLVTYEEIVDSREAVGQRREEEVQSRL